MARVFVGVGSNIGTEGNVREALRRLSGLVRIAGVSTFYRTRPEGHSEQADFYNGVVQIETELPPERLKDTLREIERELGRVRTADRYAPRTIDLDILVYDELIMRTDDLVIPDPEITDRAFLAIPLCELAPDMILPGSGIGICNIAAVLAGDSMEALPEYTETLREETLRGHAEDRELRA